jgi:CheY-like chemotaxis protein
VLVIERDRDSGLAQMVRGLGYDVLQLEDPREALRLVRAQGGLVKLILADLYLPHMDAGELAERAKAVQPGLLRQVLGPPRQLPARVPTEPTRARGFRASLA